MNNNHNDNSELCSVRENKTCLNNIFVNLSLPIEPNYTSIMGWLGHFIYSLTLCFV